MSAETRLATYGTLIPGEVNHHQLEALRGTWSKGTVRGHLHAKGWGSDLGCPGMVPDPDGAEIAVHIFESQDLPAHWERLDLFEGSEYRREPSQAMTDDGAIEASIYRVLATDT